MSEVDSAVRLPGAPRDPAADDFRPYIVNLLKSSNILGDLAENTDTKSSAWGPFKGTPASFQIIESGATALGRGWATLAAAFGGAAAVGGTIAAFWNLQGTGVRIALVAGLAVVVSAALVAIAVIVRGDLQARGTGAAAQYQARAIAVDSLLRASMQREPWRPGELEAVLTEAMSGFEARLIKTDDWHPIAGVRINAAHGPEAKLDGEWEPFTACEISFAAR